MIVLLSHEDKQEWLRSDVSMTGKNNKTNTPKKAADKTDNALIPRGCTEQNIY